MGGLSLDRALLLSSPLIHSDRQVHLALLGGVDTRSYKRAYSGSECQIGEEGHRARTRLDHIAAVFSGGWVGRSTDRLIRGPSSPSLVLSVFRGLEEQTKICSHLSWILRRSMTFASHLRHYAGGCNAMIIQPSLTARLTARLKKL